MGSISAGDLTLLRARQDTQKTIERLYIWGFPQMWKGRVNNLSIARGDQTVAYDTGALQGDFAFADLTEGLMVWFGTSEGSDDLGRRMLLSITGTAASGSMIVDWYDDIELSDDDYITIVHLRPPWPKLSWFSSANGFYKSGPPASAGGAGIDYSDQNTDPPPHVVIGRPAVAPVTGNDLWWLDETVGVSDVSAAWQAIGAGSQAESYINLNKPGTNDLAVGVAPSWAAATGWTFNGATQYLSTSLTLLSTYTIIARITLVSTASDRVIFGSNKTNANFNATVDHQSGFLFDLDANWGNGNLTAISNVAALSSLDQVIAIASNRVYINGSFVGAISGAFSVGAPATFPIGAGHDGATINAFYNGSVTALAIYNRQLTDSEVLTISQKVAVLASSTLPANAIPLDATSSQAVATGATLSTYAWGFTPSSGSATIINSTSSQATLYAEPDQKFYASLTLTDSNANSSVGYRPIICDGGALGITDFVRSGIIERYNSVNVACDIVLTSPDISNTQAINPTIDWSDIDGETMIIITANDAYGATEKNITFRSDSRYTDRENILFWGFIVGETRRFEGNSASITLPCVGPAMAFFLYSLSITGVRTSTDWYEMDSDLMYVASLLFHLFKWHSTLLEITDWILPWSDTTLRSAVEEWTEGNIMERAQQFAGPHGRLMAITATSQGEFFVEEDANLISESDRNALTTTLTLENEDIIETKQAQINHFPQVSQVYISGGVSQGVLGSFTPFLSISQFVRKARGVDAAEFERLMLPSQTEANRLCGRLLAVLNREKIDMNLSFAGIYREIISPADQQWINTGTEVFSASDITNLRGSTDLNSIRLVPRQVTKNPPVRGFGSTDVVFDVEAPAGELSGQTITLLAVDPFYVAPDVDTEIPILGEPLDALISGDDTNGVEVYIYNDATWVTRNTGLSGDSLKVRDLKVVPYWWIYQNSTDHENCMVWIATDGGLYFTEDFGKNWANRTPLEALDSAPAGVTPSTVAYYSIDVFSALTDINNIITAMCRETVTGTIHSWLLISTNGGRNWTSSKRS
jgi:hypothetical protein